MSNFLFHCESFLERSRLKFTYAIENEIILCQQHTRSKISLENSIASRYLRCALIYKEAKNTERETGCMMKSMCIHLVHCHVPYLEPVI